MTALLRTDGVAKAFGGVHALSDCTIEVEPGSIAGLIGPNGSGKTTLFNMITGYGRVDSGDVYLNETKITNLAPDKVFALGIGRTFQLTRVFSRLTVMENMIVAAHYKERSGGQGGWLRNPFARAGGAATRQRAMELLEFTGIARLAGDRAETLSYGQRKLLAIAAALMPRPDLILLDEPVAGINPTMIRSIEGIIRRVNREGIAVLIVEHNMQFIMNLCQHVVVLEQGRKIAEGPPALVRSDPRVLAAYIGTAPESASDG